MAGKQFFDTDNDFRPAEFMHFVSTMLIPEPKGKKEAPCMVLFCAFDQQMYFIDLAKKLQPKIVIAENVKGILLGEAKEYVKKIEEIKQKHYSVQNLSTKLKKGTVNLNELAIILDELGYKINFEKIK